MSMIIAQELDENLRLRISELETKYPKFCVKGGKLDVFVSRIFNDEKRTVLQPRVSAVLEIVKNLWPYIEFTSLATKFGIPKGYFVEILATNFVIEDKRIPIFPNEIRVDADYRIRDIIVDEIKTLERVGKTYEIVGLLSDHGLLDVANDFRDGILRFEKSDFEGSIMSFRKVIEGFRNLTESKVIDNSEDRTKEIRGFLSKAYSLLSNFGQHFGTRGLVEEAVFAKELTILVSEYLIKKTS